MRPLNKVQSPTIVTRAKRCMCILCTLPVFFARARIVASDIGSPHLRHTDNTNRANATRKGIHLSDTAASDRDQLLHDPVRNSTNQTNGTTMTSISNTTATGPATTAYLDSRAVQQRIFFGGTNLTTAERNKLLRDSVWCSANLTKGSTISTLNSTADLDCRDVVERGLFFGTAIGAGSIGLLVCGIYVLRKRRKNVGRVAAEVDSSRGMAQVAQNHAEYQLMQHPIRAPRMPEVDLNRGLTQVPHNSEGDDIVTSSFGLGVMVDEELEDIRADESLSPTTRNERMAAWAQAKAAALRESHATHLNMRWWSLMGIFVLYVGASVGLPLLHRKEATCSRGFFWETHMQFYAIFMLTKMAELWLCSEDPTIDLEMSFRDLAWSFCLSFLGFLDAYTDADGVVIAHSCGDPFAQQLAILMGTCYLFGVVLLQWVILGIFAAQDPSHACIMKLLHMDLLASCITLPPEQKWLWDRIAFARTVGEDIPQACLQTLYLWKVKHNPFMLVSVLVAVCSSFNALLEARARALEAASVAAEFEVIYSCSQDKTLRCWQTANGKCTQVIEVGSCANNVVATRGMLYTAHDDGIMREWSLETSQVTRTFGHPGKNGTVYVTSDRAYTCYLHRRNNVIKEWNLDTGECIQEFEVPDKIVMVVICVKNDSLYAADKQNSHNIAEWSLTSGQVSKTFVGHAAEINALFATKKRVFSGSRDRTVKEWALEDGSCVRTFDDHSGDFLVGLSVAKSSLYHSSNTDNAINERSLVDGTVIRKFVGHTALVHGTLLVNKSLYSCGHDRAIKQWNLETGQCERTLLGHDDLVNNVVVQHRGD